MKTSFIPFLLIFLVSCTSKSEYQIIEFNKALFILDNGVLLYKNTPFTGKLIRHEIVGNLIKETEYVQGKKYGLETKKNKNTDKLVEKRHYINGKKSGVHEAWWPNGQKRMLYQFNDTGEYHGLVEEWYRNGQKSKEFHFTNGKENGSQKMWEYNGKLRANFVTKNGERFGLIGLKKCYSVDIRKETYR